MRPFESDRRVYLLHRAHLMNEDAADALLKDLEEPPSYAVIVLIADDLGPLPDTILSRCQLVPFRRLSEKAIRGSSMPARLSSMQIVAPRSRGRRRPARPARAATRPASVARREALIDQSAPGLPGPSVRPLGCAAVVLANAQDRATEARDLEEATIVGLELTAREAEQRVKRAAPREREELLAQLEELGSCTGI